MASRVSSTQMSATQPESDDNPTYGFTQEFLHARSGAHNSVIAEDRNVEESNQENNNSFTILRTPRRNRKYSATTSGCQSVPGMLSGHGDAYFESPSQESMPLAVRDFFEMLEGDEESFPQFSPI